MDPTAALSSFSGLVSPARGLTALKTDTEVEQVCVVIRVQGESMEPLLYENASILVDRQRTRRQEHRVYVVRTNDGVVVKRAGRDEYGGWILLSEHPSWLPVPWPADAETIGQVVWTARSCT